MLILRALALTIPAVTVDVRLSGLPTASTHSPTFNSSELPNGIVGKFVQAFATFLVGEIYNVLLLFLIFVGLYLIIKRKQPNYFNNKLLGLFYK